MNCTDFHRIPPSARAEQRLRLAGDLSDPAASANDPVFWFHLGNLDRRKSQWQINNSDAAPYYYGYPLYGARWVSENRTFTLLNEDDYQGLGLNEDISHHFGFKDEDLGILAHPDDPDRLWTHADALCYLQPRTAPYVYDTLIPPPKPLDRGTPIVSASTAQAIFTVGVVLIISILGTLEIYRWQYINADKVRYAPVQRTEAANEEESEES